MEWFFLFKGKEPLTLYIFKIIQVAAKSLKLELVKYISKGLVVMLLVGGLFWRLNMIINDVFWAVL